MEPDRKPDVVDLTKYRKSAEEQAKARAKASAPKREPVLGARPNAALLLVLILVAVAIVFILPRLMTLR